MSRLAAAALVLAPTAAVAAPLTITPGGTALRASVAHGTRDASHAGGFSHVIYMNSCLPGGCTIFPGDDDSRSDRSSIPQTTSQLGAWPHGPTQWDALVRCVRETYAPFDIQIVTEDPGQSPHFEVYVGGSPEDIQFSDALGVAPFIPCGGVIDNVPTFVFANGSDSTDILCWAVAQETAHAFGLDHELERDDPMTYLNPPSHKRFQNQSAPCGERESEPRTCWCGDEQQNSFAYLTQTFGGTNLPAPGIQITSPHDGAWVKPGFPVAFTIDSLLTMKVVELSVDSTITSSLAHPPFAFNAPPGLAPGSHTVAVRATDQRDLVGDARVTVQMLTACEAGCAAGTVCLGGYCLPDSAQPGGLGTACAATADCGSSQCTADGKGHAYCTDACDPGRGCPSGYTCVGGEGDAGGVCWPGGDSGGCSAGGDTRPAGGLLAIGAALIAALRRRRPPR